MDVILLYSGYQHVLAVHKNSYIVRPNAKNLIWKAFSESYNLTDNLTVCFPQEFTILHK
jgi:hypothetical protein